MALEKTWFERDEYRTVRNCTCLCGHRFKSQARELPCVESQEVKDKEGRPIIGQDGHIKTQPVTVKRLLSKVGCPKCSSYWLKDFT